MSPKIFELSEREEIKVKMIEAGFELIKTHGMTHASVEKVAEAAGLKKSTFYNFFPSKEMFVFEIISYQRDFAKEYFNSLLGTREKVTKEEAEAFLKMIIFSERSIYRYLTAEDMEKLRKALPSKYGINPAEESIIIGALFSHMEDVREDVDFKLMANIIKIMAIAFMNRESLHKDALDRTIEVMYQTLFSLIFK